MQVYPIFLFGLARRHTVVVGGGDEAQRKVLGLLACDAAVTVIAGHVTEAIGKLADAERLQWIRRDYRPGDLSGAFLVISAAETESRLDTLVAEAERERALINVVDDVERSSFVAGSVVRRGRLTVAISTSGAAPALAVRLRQRLERELGPGYDALLERLLRLRGPLRRRYPDFERRRERWYALVDAALRRLETAGQRGENPTSPRSDL